MIVTTEIGTVIVITDQEVIDAMIAIKKNKKAEAGAKEEEADAEEMKNAEIKDEKNSTYFPGFSCSNPVICIMQITRKMSCLWTDRETAPPF